MDVNDTLQQRGNRYGEFSHNAELTQALLRTVESMAPQPLPAVHLETIHMIFHKIARMTMGDPWYEDNPHDIAGYATLLEGYIKDMNDAKAEYS